MSDPTVHSVTAVQQASASESSSLKKFDPADTAAFAREYADAGSAPGRTSASWETLAGRVGGRAADYDASRQEGFSVIEARKKVFEAIQSGDVTLTNVLAADYAVQASMKATTLHLASGVSSGLVTFFGQVSKTAQSQ